MTVDHRRNLLRSSDGDALIRCRCGGVEVEKKSATVRKSCISSTNKLGLHRYHTLLYTGEHTVEVITESDLLQFRSYCCISVAFRNCATVKWWPQLTFVITSLLLHKVQLLLDTEHIATAH